MSRASHNVTPISPGEPPRLLDASHHARADIAKIERRKQLKLSILMPAYNEERTIFEAVAGVLRTIYPCEFELIVVDDGSSDRTGELLAGIQDPNLRVVTHPRNLGKGAALQTAAALAGGSHIVPFDADLEYDPTDLPLLMAPVLQGRYEVVYGTRLFGLNTRYQSYRHAMGNRVLTLAANVLFDAYLSDMHSCLKLIPVELFRDLALGEDGFGLDTEITAKLLKRGIRPFEIPVTYNSRSFELGKKITWRDGVECLQVLARVRRQRTNSARTSQTAREPVQHTPLPLGAVAAAPAPSGQINIAGSQTSAGAS